MAKKYYVSPVADLLKFDYKENVVASPGGVDASHCVNGGNQKKCGGLNKNKCGLSTSPGSCYDNTNSIEEERL